LCFEKATLILFFAQIMKRNYSGSNPNNPRKIQYVVKPKVEYLFSGGDAASWSVIRNTIIDKFRSEGIWDSYVHHANPTTYQVTDEKIFTDVEPVHPDYVDNKVQRYTAEINTRHTNIINYLNGLGLPQATLRTQQIEEEIKHLDNLSKIVTKREEFEREFIQAKSAFITSYQLHIKAVASCNKVFNESFSPSVKSSIQIHLTVGHFKRAWIEVNNRYSTITGGASAVLQFQNLLNATKFTGGNIDIHLGILNNLLNELESIPNSGVTDLTRVQYLLNSLTESQSKEFSEVISYHDQHRSSYIEFCDALRTKNSQILLKRKVHNQLNQSHPKVNAITTDVSTQNNNNNNHNNNNTHHQLNMVCGKCGKSSHSTDQCQKDSICSYCGKKGHRTKNCFKDPNGPRYKADRSSSSSSSSSSSKSGRQVSLAQNFENKNSRPNKS